MRDYVAAGASRRRTGGVYQNAIEVVATWCQTVQGSLSTPVALRQIADKLRAEIVAVTRVDHPQQGKGNADHAACRVVSFDHRANFVGEVAGFHLSYAEAICGRYLGAAKSGSIWTAQLSDFRDDTRLHAPLRHRRLSFTVVIALERHATCSDFLELHFAEEPPLEFTDDLAELATVLSDCWKSRSLGFLSNTLLEARRSISANAAAPATNVLDVENPCQLSRAEYRVCLLFSRGLNRNALLDELSITLSTLRSHLRSIYAKTGTHSQAELLQLLLTHIQQTNQGGAYHVA